MKSANKGVNFGKYKIILLLAAVILIPALIILSSDIEINGAVEDRNEYDPNDEANRLTGECYETIADGTGHTHTWCGGAYNTEDYRSPEGVYHSHSIDEANNLAQSSSGHTHRLR
ncbi:MAG: hypothetical protein GOV02_00845 [Candidatus Aenigmarchaeota archaeon]|nr:hypothetical protein [Candidatus Aenigmarchaeota archaeon]